MTNAVAEHLRTNNLNITGTTELLPPDRVLEMLPITDVAAETVTASREAIRRIITGEDNRLLVLVGPCSIHDEKAALDYAERLVELRQTYADRMEILMRTYFEKPRTTLGWTGLINDPWLNGSFNVREGFQQARKILIAINELGLPTGTEFLDPIVPAYTSDVISWACLGARTAESQTHRQMASGLSMPFGFKNGTGGSVDLAIHGMLAAAGKHCFLGINGAGHVSTLTTAGNRFGHIVLRGGSGGSNYGEQEIAAVAMKCQEAGVNDRIMVDCSHANSGKDATAQPGIFKAVLRQRRANNPTIMGLMLESHINGGSQKFSPAPDALRKLRYGTSITDPCLDWDATASLLAEAYEMLV